LRLLWNEATSANASYIPSSSSKDWFFHCYCIWRQQHNKTSHVL
jgi:hypothetical protein